MNRRYLHGHYRVIQELRRMNGVLLGVSKEKIILDPAECKQGCCRGGLTWFDSLCFRGVIG